MGELGIYFSILGMTIITSYYLNRINSSIQELIDTVEIKDGP